MIDRLATVAAIGLIATLMAGGYARVGPAFLGADELRRAWQPRDAAAADGEQAALTLAVIASAIFLASRSADVAHIATALIVGCGVEIAVLARRRSAQVALAAIAVAVATIATSTILAGDLPLVLRAAIVAAAVATPGFSEKYRVEATLDAGIAAVAACSLGVTIAVVAIGAAYVVAMLATLVRRGKAIEFAGALGCVTLCAIAVAIIFEA